MKNVTAKKAQGA